MTPEQIQRVIGRAAAKLQRIEKALSVAEADAAFLKQGASRADIEAARRILQRSKRRAVR